MTMKNKLTKHHKSKASFVIRNVSIAVSTFVALVAIVAIPTYINVKYNSSKTGPIAHQSHAVSEEKIEKIEPIKTYVDNN